MLEGELPLGQTTQGVELLKYIYTHTHIVMTDQWLIRYTTWNQNKMSQYVSTREKTNTSKRLGLSLERCAGFNCTAIKRKGGGEGGGLLSSMYF